MVYKKSARRNPLGGDSQEKCTCIKNSKGPARGDLGRSLLSRVLDGERRDLPYPCDEVQGETRGLPIL